MKSLRMFALVLYLAGLLLIVVGIEQSSQAQNCDPTEFGSAKCKNAHSKDPIQNDSGSYCEMSGSTCAPTSDTQCVDRWGIAQPGQCQVEGFGSDPTHTCFQDHHQTFVTIYWYEARCIRFGTTCRCEWDRSTTSQTLAMCDCYDIAN